LPGATLAPYPSVSDAARETGIVLTSASKAWNVAGLKAAMMVATGRRPREIIARLPPDLPYHAGHLGVLAAKAAFTEGDAWLAQTIAILDRNRALLGDLLADALPGAAYRPPRAGYLAWIDMRALGVSDDPARVILKEGRLALSPGPTFGTQGKGFVRLNIATTRAILEDAVTRMRQALVR